MWIERRKSILNIKENLFSPENGTLFKDVNAYGECITIKITMIFSSICFLIVVWAHVIQHKYHETIIQVVSERVTHVQVFIKLFLLKFKGCPFGYTKIQRYTISYLCF